MDELTYFDTLSDFKLFMFNTQYFWYKLFLAVLIIRAILNLWINYVSDTGIDSDSAMEPRNGDDIQFLIITVFTFWWRVLPKESKLINRMKKWTNVLHLFFIALTLFVIIMFFQLQELNHKLPESERDWLYFIR